MRGIRRRRDETELYVTFVNRSGCPVNTGKIEELFKRRLNSFLCKPFNITDVEFYLSFL